MTQKKFVFRQLSRYICTRRIQFLIQNIDVVSFSDNVDVFANLSAGVKTYLQCNFSIFSMLSLID